MSKSFFFFANFSIQVNITKKLNLLFEMQCSLKFQPLILVYVREALESLLKQLVNLFKYSRDLVARNCLGIPQRPKFMERKLQFEASIFHIPS